MITNNVAHVALLNAIRFGVDPIYFVGHFLRDNPLTMKALGWGVWFWSKGASKALFTAHEGNLGVLGALLIDLPSHPAEAAQLSSSSSSSSHSDNDV